MPKSIEVTIEPASFTSPDLNASLISSRMANNGWESASESQSEAGSKNPNVTVISNN
jgi:hypothetical protein